MLKLNPELSDELRRLHGNPAFKKLFNHLKKCSAEADKMAILTDTDGDLHRGVARGWRQALDLIEQPDKDR